MKHDSVEQLIPSLVQARLFNSSLFYPDGSETVSRETEYYEFSVYSSDSGFFRENGQLHRIVPGVRRFTAPHTKVSGIGPYQCRTIRFTVSGIDEEAQRALFSRIPSFELSPRPEIFNPVFDLLLSDGAPAGPTAVITERAALYLLIHLLLSEASEALSEKTEPASAVNRIKFYISEHFRENFSLADLGNAVGYHPVYLHRLFKAQVGTSPLEYQTSIRLDQAKYLLSTTKKTILEIAAETGYSSVSYFQNLFRKKTGLTPLAYRKQNSFLY